MRSNTCLHRKYCLVSNMYGETMASKKTKVVGGRVPHNVAKEMEMLGLSVPECVQIALSSKREANGLLKIELRKLLSEEEILASRLAHVNYMIDDYMKRLNIDKSKSDKVLKILSKVDEAQKKSEESLQVSK